MSAAARNRLPTARCRRGIRVEPDQPRLLRVNRQAVLAHPLGQDLHDPPGVLFSGNPDHEVVRIANQERFPLQRGFA